MRTDMEIDALEDTRVLVQARCLGAAGNTAARMHAQSLMQRALLAAEQHQYWRAQEYRRRCSDFTRRFLIESGGVAGTRAL